MFVRVLESERKDEDILSAPQTVLTRTTWFSLPQPSRESANPLRYTQLIVTFL